jgi:hypothetical protein
MGVGNGARLVLAPPPPRLLVEPSFGLGDDDLPNTGAAGALAAAAACRVATPSAEVRCCDRDRRSPPPTPADDDADDRKLP